MSRDEALNLARVVLGPASLLGYLLGRGGAWGDTERFAACRKAVGDVMGAAYLLLTPVWRAHPDLDPARYPKALGLERQAAPADPVRPADLLPLVHVMQEEIPAVLHVLASFQHDDSALAGTRRAAEELKSALARAATALVA